MIRRNNLARGKSALRERKIPRAEIRGGVVDDADSIAAARAANSTSGASFQYTCPGSADLTLGARRLTMSVQTYRTDAGVLRRETEYGSEEG